MNKTKSLMEDQKTTRNNLFLIIAVILLIAPLYIQGLWIYISGLDYLKTQGEKSAFYNSHFPSFLQGNYPLVLIAFFSCTAAFFLSALSLNKIRSSLRWVAYITILISFLVGFLSLFQMM
jgi:hypothetical protein